MTEREYENYIYVMSDIEKKLHTLAVLMIKYDKYFSDHNRILDCDLVNEIQHYMRYIEKAGSMIEIHGYAIDINSMCARLLNNQRRIVNTLNMRIKSTENPFTKLISKIKLRKEEQIHLDLREAYDLSLDMKEFVAPYTKGIVVE